MKIRKYIKTVCVVGLSILTTSCLDLEPKANLGDNLVWNTADNFQLFANQFYGYAHDFDIAISDNPHSDWRADLACTTTVNAYSQGTNTIPISDKNYTDQYKNIYYCNLLLKNAATFSNQSAIAVPMGEAYFFRAFCYFELVQLFGNVILLTEPIDLDSKKLYESRDDRGLVVDQCITDLEQAAQLLPETVSEAGRINKSCAYALMARIALYEGTWQKFHTNGAGTTTNTSRSTDLLSIAKNAADKVIKTGKYKLFYNAALGNQSYRYMFILEDGVQCNPANLSKADNTEYIFYRRHRNGDKMAWNITHGLVSNSAIWRITRKLANMYRCQDGLPVNKSPLFKGYAQPTDEFQNRDNRMDNNMRYNGEKYWDNDGKWRTTWTDADLDNALTAGTSGQGYINQKWGTERNVDDYYESYDFPVIRYAEVLLAYAEATYELNGNISDDDLNKSLNLVRARVNPTMAKLSNSLVSANGLSMREEIRVERTIEFAIEGHRADDVKRWAIAPTEMPKDLTGVKVTGTWYESNFSNPTLNSEGCVVWYTDRVWNDKLYLYPIPSDQLQLNPQLGQNPGWSN